MRIHKLPKKPLPLLPHDWEKSQPKPELIHHDWQKTGPKPQLIVPKHRLCISDDPNEPQLKQMLFYPKYPCCGSKRWVYHTFDLGGDRMPKARFRAHCPRCHITYELTVFVVENKAGTSLKTQCEWRRLNTWDGIKPKKALQLLGPEEVC